ncbi:osmotin-like protein [Cryptomeria japonica]|uniref:osmotin-like protein n=1 Tax=Cryptomeria japonica TaxID=3369 RepID=UPI0027DA0D57|nr:osmotin-like protein [Cryptomeria japonica]
MVRCGSPLKLTIVNDCPSTIWPALQPSAGYPVLGRGGFALNTKSHVSIDVPNEWHGRVWGRTMCSFSGGKGSCFTGDCSGKLECGGSGGATPATLAQLSLHTSPTGKSSYTVSLVDGMNLPMTITPHIGGNAKGPGDSTVAGCRIPNISNLDCPEHLKVKRGNEMIACKSACQAFRTDQYCCTNQFNIANTCKPTEFSERFKKACPKASTYAHDAVLHHCDEPNEIKIIFCHV